MHDIGDWSHFIIQSLPDGIIAIDGHLQVTDLNRAGAKLTGPTRGEALGQYCGAVLRSSLCGQECPLKTAISSGEMVSREAIFQNRRGQKIEVMLAAAALRDDQGTLLGRVESFRDIGLFKRMENKRRQLVRMFTHDLKTPVVAVPVS
jgi:PAS domain S-box-containing protein